MQLEYPSPLFPAQPAIVIEVPAEWQPQPAPGTVLAAREQVEDNFATNVVLTVTRYSRDSDLTAHVSAVRGALAELTSAEVGDVFPVNGVGHPASGFDSAFVDPDAGSLVRIDVLVLVPHDDAATVDLVHFVATMAADSAESAYPVCQEIAKSLRIS